MIAFTSHTLQQDYPIIADVPIYLDETREEKIFTIFRLVALIVHKFGTIDSHDSERLSDTYRNDKIILHSETNDKYYTPYGSQRVSIANVDGETIFAAHYLIDENIVSSPTLIIDVNHLDPLFDDNVPADLPDQYSSITRRLYELWRHLLETHPAARTPAYDYLPAIVPSEFF